MLVVKLKLGRACNMPTKAMNAVLEDVAASCNLARNRMMRAWVRWREDNPDYQPGQRLTRKGEPKCNAKGDPVAESPIMSQEFQKQLYHIGRDVARHVQSNVMSQAWANVCDDLKDRMSYRHHGEARFKWQAILTSEVNAPSYAATVVPVPNNQSVFGYCGHLTRQSDAKRLQPLANDHAVLSFPLFSKESGRKETSLVCLVEVRQMSAGHKRILKRVATGQYKMSDSQLVKKGSNWFLHMCVKVPDNEPLPSDRHAILEPCGLDARSPFAIELPGDEGPRRFNIGWANLVVQEFRRIELRRKTLRFRSRNAKAGHGAKSFYKKLRPYSRAFQDLQERYQKQLVSDIVKDCERNDCGTLIYLEPKLRHRDQHWLAKNSVPFDWTSLVNRLKFKCESRGIKLIVEKGWNGLKTEKEAVA